MKECSICESLMNDADRFCPYCGYVVPRAPYTPDEADLLYRKEDNGKPRGQRSLNLHLVGTFSISAALVLDFLFLPISFSIHNEIIQHFAVPITLFAAVALIPILRSHRANLRQYRMKGNLLLKTHALSKRIATELEKISHINKLLKNIDQPQMRTKVLEGKAKIDGLIDSLIKCKMNLDFLRFYNDYSIIDTANRKGSLQPEQLIQLLAHEDDKLRRWKVQFRDEIHHPVPSRFYTQKLALAKAFKQQIALAMVSNILSSTTLLYAEIPDLDFDSSESDINQQMERLNYEIDRLDAELELDKLRL